MTSVEFTSWPLYSEEEARAVSDVLLSNKVNYWTGCECREFEREYASWIGTKYAVAVANGTLALEIALKVLGIGVGDEVVVTSRTFFASASSIVAVGATPVFADVDINSQNITAETISAVLTPRTRAVICVHLAGWPCDMDPIMKLADKHDLFVVEDCAQAHGAIYKSVSVGSIGHIGAWSFCQDKIITTGGEGGMLTTNDHKLWSKIWSYKDHGKSHHAVYDQQHSVGFRWLHESFGSNARMTEMQAVIGRIQIKKMEQWHNARRRNAEAILDICRCYSNSIRTPVLPSYNEHAWYKCYVFVKEEGLLDGWSRNRIINEIVALGVPCYSGSCPEVYMEKAFDDTLYRPQRRHAVASELGETSLMFLVHPTLSLLEITKTCEAIASVMQRASR